MKKLLALLVSVATAFYAMASGTFTSSGTSFESGAVIAGEAFNVNSPDKESTGSDVYWFTSASDDYGIITNYDGEASLETPISTRPEQWASTANQNYLLLDTANEAIFRTVHPVTATETNAQEIGTGLYIDTLVQFTAAEDAPQVETGVDKLAVWLQVTEGTEAVGTEDEEGYVAAVPATTNLVITAGYIDATSAEIGSNVILTNYICSGAKVKAGDWKRLTIRSVKNAYAGQENAVGFIVYIDGVAVAYGEGQSAFAAGVTVGNAVASFNNERKLFPSLVGWGSNDANAITAVGFKGSGAVDDISFTTTAPGFTVEASFMITWTEGALKSLTVDGVAQDISGNSWTATTIKGSYNVAVEYKDGWEVSNPTYVNCESDNNGTVTLTPDTAASIAYNAAYKPLMFNGVSYASVEELQNDISGQEAVEITLSGDYGSFLNFAAFTGSITIDLAGNSIISENTEWPAIYASGGLILTDSIGGGIVQSECEYGVIYADSVTIGKMNDDFAIVKGLISGSSISIVQGKFDATVDEAFAYAASVADDSTCSAAVDADGYWVVTAAGGGDDPVETYVASIGDTKYETLEAAIADAQNDDTVTLLGNVTLSATIAVENKAITLDMDGNTVTAGFTWSATTPAAFWVKNSGNLTLTNGTLSTTVEGIRLGVKKSTNENEKGTATIASDAVITTSDIGVMLYGGSTLTSSGTIESSSTGYAAIQGNGLDTLESTITITGGSVSSASNHAIYHPQPGTLTVSGGAIEISGVTGIEMRAGTLNMSAGTVTATGTYATPDANTNGSTVNGAAIVLSQHSTGENVTANITGGSITAGADGKTLVVANTTGADPVNVTATIAAAVNFEADNAVILIDTLKLEGNADDGYSVVVKSTTPTIGGTAIEVDESGMITNITSAANGETVAGELDTTKFPAYYTVTVTDSVLSIELNEAAIPAVGEATVEEESKPAIEFDGKGNIKITVTGSEKALKYTLQYKAGLGTNPETLQPYAWADVDTSTQGGTGAAMQLTAPASGDAGFYRIKVTD